MLHLSLPMPPSDNKIYANVGRMRVLTRDAERYKKSVAEAVTNMALRRRVEFHEDVGYKLVLEVFFKAVENASWNPTGKRKTKRRFKKQDLHNRQKLVIDAVMESIGLDDSHVIELSMVKLCDPKHPRIEVDIQRCTWV